MKIIAAALLAMFASSTYAQVVKPQAPTHFCVDERCSSDPVETEGGLKWHPGHYMAVDRMESTADVRAMHFKQIDAIANEPSVRGIKLAVYWSVLEGAKGDYSAGFAILDAYLAKLKATNKYLILSVQDRQFGGYDPSNLSVFFPAYILKEYGVTKMSYGIITRAWQAGTMDRLIALSRAYAARYDGHPNFEMFQSEETSVGVANSVDGYSPAAYETQLRRFIADARKSWPHTQVRLNANFLGADSVMASLIDYSATYNTAVGGPDTIPDQTIQANRLFSGTTGDKDYRGVLPFVSEVQSPSLGGKEGTFTAAQLFTHAMKEVRPSYFVWVRNTYQGGAAQKWDTGLLPYIRSIKGSINSTCPSKLTCSPN